MTDIHQARRLREMKALSGVVAALSLPIYGSAVFYDAWDARFVSMYVGSVVLTIAIGLQIYVRRPAAFGVTEIGDSLRTRYAVPSAAASDLVGTPQPSVPIARSYALPTPDRVTRGELLRQCLIATCVVTLYAMVVLTVTWLLALSPLWAFFVAAGVILAGAFWIGGAFAVGASGPSNPPVSTVGTDVALGASTAPTPHAA